eukprot:UN01909
MLITKQRLSQQTIDKYLRESNDALKNQRHIDIIASCDCIPCKHRNWNVMDVCWEKNGKHNNLHLILILKSVIFLILLINKLLIYIVIV